MIPIVRAIDGPHYKRVVGVMASQMAKTDNMLNAVGRRLDDDPVPILFVGPTKSNLEKVIEPRFNKMVRSCDSLWRKLAKGKRSTKTNKNISGVSFRLAWAGSATELASQEAGFVIVDERDRMPNDVGGEGDPVSIVEARIATYPDGKSCIFSTPTIGNVNEEKNDTTGLTHWLAADPADVQSPIWKLWQEGTRFEWAWPCPDCSEYFIPRFSLLKWPEKCTPQRALKEAKLACPRCGVLIGDEHKTEMNARGVYVAPGQKVNPNGTIEGDVPDNDVASFWVSGLCSPWRTFGQRARSFLEASKSGEPTRIQAVVNTAFGELYKVGGEAPAWESVRDLREPYQFGEVPTGVRLITCGVDVQKDRLVYVIRGWGANWESWLIRHGEIYGETEYDAVWTELDNLLLAPIGNLRIRRMGIDSGYRPGDRFKRPENQIYLFCRRHMGLVIPTKGHETQDKPYRANKIDLTVRGKVIKKGLQLWHLNSDYFKSWVHARIDWPQDQPGGWHLSQDTTDDYCQQLVAEARAVKPSGGITWVRLRRENHYLDCEAINVACAHILHIHTLKPIPAPSPATSENAEQTPEQKPIHKPPPRRGGFITGWK
jgi:phage terminase large subunit GpA-like protein